MTTAAVPSKAPTPAMSKATRRAIGGSVVVAPRLGVKAIKMGKGAQRRRAIEKMRQG